MRIITLVFFITLLNIGFALAQKRNIKEFEPGKDMVSIDQLRGTADLKVGQKAYFQYSVHGSVGLDGEWNIDDETILKKVDEHVTYKREYEGGMTGNDGATVTIVFEALKAGKVNLNFKKIFRGETESESKIKITVE